MASRGGLHSAKLLALVGKVGVGFVACIFLGLEKGKTGCLVVCAALASVERNGKAFPASHFEVRMIVSCFIVVCINVSSAIPNMQSS